MGTKEYTRRSGKISGRMFCRQILDAFRREEFAEGICQGVRSVGEKLVQYFPHQRDDVDEISNEIVYRR
jgi:uncharacterized membrane protein